MNQKTLLIFNMSRESEWRQGIVNRNYFVLEELKKRPEISQVLAVDFLPFTAKQSIRNIIQDLRGAKGDVYQAIGTRCWQAAPGYYVYTSSQNVRESVKIIEKIKSVLKKIQAKDLLVWSYNPFMSAVFETWSDHVTVFDAVDNWLYHPAYEDYQTVLQTHYQKIEENSRTVFATSPSIIKELFANHRRARWIPNGVAFELWQQSHALPLELQTISAPRVGYIGNLQERVDYDLLEFLAVNNSEVNLVLIGKVWESVQKKIKKISKFPNIHLIDRVSYAALPAYVQYFDVCLVPHLKNKFTASMDPMKIYEYLAMGKPVITSHLPTEESLKPLLYYAETPADWQHQLNTALVNDSLSQVELRKKLVKNHDWSKRVDNMMKNIMTNFSKI